MYAIYDENNFLIKLFAESNFLFSIFQGESFQKEVVPSPLHIEDIKLFEVM